MTDPLVSIIMRSFNEGWALRETLPALRAQEYRNWELIVIDSGSTDGSVEIAERCGAKVVQFEFNGTWPKKKNWALENLRFNNDWVLILDADEVLPPESAAEIADAVANTKGIAGYWINRRFFFLGRWLRHSYYPNWNLRLFRHSLGRYERLTTAETQSGDNEVHEHVVVQGPTDVWRVVRTLMGATNPVDAAPGTIRGDLALEVTENLVHGSDSAESAKREIEVFFPRLC